MAYKGGHPVEYTDTHRLLLSRKCLRLSFRLLYISRLLLFMCPRIYIYIYIYMQYGANMIPVRSIAVMSAISLLFIFIGPLNTLGTILTIPFMFTYAAVDYAYFSLAMSDDDRKRRDQPTLAERADSADGQSAVECDLDSSGLSDYDDNDGDLDQLFPAERKKRSLAVSGTCAGCTRNEEYSGHSISGNPEISSDDSGHVTSGNQLVMLMNY